MRIAVDRCRGTEDQPVDAGLGHRLEQGEGTGDIVAVIVQGALNRLADGLQSREMNDAIDRIFAEYPAGRPALSRMSPSTVTSGRFADDAFNSVNHLW